jgi:hypothetical protein
MAPNVSPISDTQPESSLNPCNVKMTVSVRRGRKGKWREARDGEKVVSGNEIEILASCGCRAMIDIKPDGRYQLIGVFWSEMMFIPDGKHLLVTRLPIGRCRFRGRSRPGQRVCRRIRSRRR